MTIESSLSRRCCSRPPLRAGLSVARTLRQRFCSSALARRPARDQRLCRLHPAAIHAAWRAGHVACPPLGLRRHRQLRPGGVLCPWRLCHWPGHEICRHCPSIRAYLGILLGRPGRRWLALVIGYFLFSAGVRSTYFVVATLALSIIVEQTVKSFSDITGGWNGLYVDRMTLSLGSLVRAVAIRRCAYVLHCSARGRW